MVYYVAIPFIDETATRYQSGFSTDVLPQIGTFVAAVDCRYLPECTFLDMLIYWCLKGTYAVISILKNVFSGRY